MRKKRLMIAIACIILVGIAVIVFFSQQGKKPYKDLDAAQIVSAKVLLTPPDKTMKELQKLIECGKNYTKYKPVRDQLKTLKNGWTGKRDKYEEAHRAELTLWDAANRYLHAHLPEGVKTLPISAWEKEYTALKAQREAEYDTLKETRAEVAELQKIRRCVDIALRADQPEQTQNRTKRHEQER